MPTSEYPVIITVTDQNGNAQADVTVIALGDADYIEKGITDIYGKVTLPITPLCQAITKNFNSFLSYQYPCKSLASSI